MDIRHLRYFVAVVEHGSFLSAARKLGVAQPALSLHLRNMEEELEVKLLNRHARGVVPTEAGDRLLHRARIILSEFSQIRSDVVGDQEPKGEVRVGLPVNIADLFGVHLIEATRFRYPKVRVRIVEGMSAFLLRWLAAGEVDIAMIYGGSMPKSLAVHHAWTEELQIFAPPEPGYKKLPNQPVTVADAVALPLVIPGVRHGVRAVLEAGAVSAGVVLEPTIEIDSYRQIKQVVERGLAHGVLPATAIQQDVAAGHFVTWRLVKPQIELKAYLCYAANQPLSTSAAVLGQLTWEALRAMVKESLGGMKLTAESNRPAFSTNRRARARRAVKDAV